MGKRLSNEQGRGYAMYYDRDQIEDWEDAESDEDPDDPEEERWSYHPNRP